MKNLFNTEEVCSYLKISKRTLQRKRDTGKIRFIQDGNLIRYRLEDIEAYLNKHVMNTIEAFGGASHDG
jgi:excisionase family DNA binding protein